MSSMSPITTFLAAAYAFTAKKYAHSALASAHPVFIRSSLPTRAPHDAGAYGGAACCSAGVAVASSCASRRALNLRGPTRFGAQRLRQPSRCDQESAPCFRKFCCPSTSRSRRSPRRRPTSPSAWPRPIIRGFRLVHVASPIVVASPMAVIPQSIYDDLGVAERAELERLAARLDRPQETVSTIVQGRRRLSGNSRRGRGMGRRSHRSSARTSARWRPICSARPPPRSCATRTAR